MVPEEEVAENILIMLPSVLTTEERSAGCVMGLAEVERAMRDAQCRTALAELRNQLSVKSRLLTYKSLHSRHQGPNTRLQSMVERNEVQIRLHSEKYQAVWRACLRLVEGDMAALGWKQLKKEDIRQMEDAEELTEKAAACKKKEARRREAEQRLIREGEMRRPLAVDPVPEDDDSEGEEHRAEAGEGARVISWIWTMAGTTRTNTNLEDGTRIPTAVTTDAEMPVFSSSN
jgi:hypothetical protein